MLRRHSLWSLSCSILNNAFQSRVGQVIPGRYGELPRDGLLVVELVNLLDGPALPAARHLVMGRVTEGRPYYSSLFWRPFEIALQPLQLDKNW